MHSSQSAPKGLPANKVAVVTGSTEDTSFTISWRLAQDGAHVAISSRKQQNVDRAVATLKGEGLSVTGTVCHVAKAEDREQLAEYDGGVGFLILDMNVKAHALLLSQLLPHTENRGFGCSVGVGAGGETEAQELSVENRRAGAVTLVYSVAAYVPLVLHKNKAFWNLLKKNHQLKRMGRLKDCVGFVSFLCSPDAR